MPWRQNSGSGGPHMGRTPPSITVIEIYNVRTGKRLRTLKGHKDVVAHVRYSPNGKVLLSADCSGGIRLWKSNGSLVRTLDAGSGNRGQNLAELSPDGKYIVTVSSDSKHLLKVWKVKTGKVTRSFKLAK